MTPEDSHTGGAERADDPGGATSDGATHGNGEDASAGGEELPREVVDEAERLTRLERDAVDGNEAAAYRERRDDLLAGHGYTSRIRGENTEETLVLHPSEWVVDGSVHPDRIEDIDRGIEIPLEGAGDADDWDAVDEHNASVAERVADAHGEVHGANARAFATFMSNHYARPVEEATGRMREEFLTEYFPRNAWPDEAQRAAVEESLELVVAAADET
ncbi:DUF7108 family protein [Haloglomus litoreum]|uniref:DUF7108 family protein n=1 Tax=Haloglomus litoreum TaxID=3034026 RepID=UPI0023E81062|nr:rnhA operon protein [Haloglomus sp. DT116]